MIKFTKHFRLVNLAAVIILYSCKQNEVPVDPVKTLLPACGIAVVSGYTDKTSYFPGDVVEVFLQSNTTLDCGLGFYDQKGQFVFGSNVSLFVQAIAPTDPWMNGFQFKGNAKITLPRTLESGIYFIENQIPVVVKSTQAADVTVVFPINTLNAYNSSGGKSLYGYNSTWGAQAYGVSYLRPLNDPGEEDRCSECLKWFPSLAPIKIQYISDQDLDIISSFDRSKILLIVGHSEYWTRKARNNFDTFVRSGGHAVLLTGNTMWWQVRYSSDRSEMICYKSSLLDPETDPLMKTDLWVNADLNYSILSSIGADFNNGGYGTKGDQGWDGYKIVNPKSPLLEGLNLKRGDIVYLPSTECDGAPIKSFDANGYPILDNPMNFEKLELIGFDRGSRGGAETFPTFIVMKATSSSGVIVNTAATDWCSSSGIGSTISGAQIKKITQNAIIKLLEGQNVFSQ